MKFFAAFIFSVLVASMFSVVTKSSKDSYAAGFEVLEQRTANRSPSIEK